MITKELLIAIIPVILLQLGLMIFCLIDLRARKQFKYLPKLAWILIIVLVNIFGPVCYLALGRDYDHSKDE